jgi:transglutaminase-like putative cysteine protease
MPDNEFDLYRSVLSRLLRLSPGQKASIANELRDHLEARFEELVGAGKPRDAAIRQALEEFGDAAGLAREFTQLARQRTRRLIARCTLASAVLAAVVVIGLAAFLPERRGPNAPLTVVAQDRGATPVDAAVLEQPELDVSLIDPAKLLPAPLAEATQFEFHETPLRDVAEFIAQRHGVPVMIDDAEVRPNADRSEIVVTETSRDEPLYVALNRIARFTQWRPEGVKGDGPLLAWYFEDGILYITSVFEVENVAQTVSYNVHDLLDAGFREDALIETIQEQTSGPWFTIDGVGGTLALFGELLIVRQSHAVQFEVHGLLDALRRPGRERHVMDPPGHGRLHTLLEQPVSVNFADTPLRDAISLLNDQTGAPIRFDDAAIRFDDSVRGKQVNLDAPVRLQLVDRPLRLVLELITGQVGNRFRVPLSFEVRDGNIMLTTLREAEANPRIVVYDVRDIVDDSVELTSRLAGTLQTDRGAGRAAAGAGILRMHYKIIHTTTYTYSEPVPVCHNLVLLTPRATASVSCRSHRLSIKPAPASSSRREDYYGNLVHGFSIEESHRKLTVSATSRVFLSLPVSPEPASTPPWEQLAAGVRDQSDDNWFAACEFTFDSPRVTRNPEFAAWARESLTAQRPVLDGVLDLTRRIHGDFRYDAQATSVATRTEDAFRQRHGVCQDFAHVQVACLRSLGIPARYVSGYLRTAPAPGKPRLVGADQSHAWVSVYCGAAGWVDVDPTNNVRCGTDHIPVAWGRDYDDVTPIRGVFLGGGTHELQVSVDVTPLDGDGERQDAPG